MKFFRFLIWAGQFGFCVVFPLLFFLCLGSWLQARFSLGLWIMFLFGILGLLTAVRTAKSCLQSLCRAAEEACVSREPPVGFNEHL